MQRFYFDYNATTPLAPEVINCLHEFISFDLKNPSSIHKEGREAHKRLEEARGQLAHHLGANPEEVIFNSGTTEGNNTVFTSVWEQRPLHKNKIIITTIEHDAVLKPLEALKKKGLDIQFLPVNAQGEISLTDYDQLLDEKTLLVSVMLANNETGMIFPVQKLAQKAHQKGILFHTDAACAIGKMKVSFSELGVDFLTLSGHKFYAPKGGGAILRRRKTFLYPILHGGNQEDALRAGTENILGILGMSQGLNYALKNIENELARQKELRAYLKKGLLAIDSSVVFHESITDQLPGTLHVGFKGISGQTLLANLDLEGAAASFGSACHSGSLEVSRVILALGIPEEEAFGSLRFSFGKMTTGEDVAGLLKIMDKVLGRMQEAYSSL